MLASSPAAPFRLADARRVLAVRLSSFGDIVHGTASLRALRAACPKAEILVAIDRTWAPILRCDPHIDGIIEADPIPQGLFDSFWSARGKLARRPGPRFDLALDLQGRRRSAAWVYASGARWRGGIGAPRPGWHLSFRPDTHQHAVRDAAAVLAHLGIHVPDLTPRLYPDDRVEPGVDALLRQAGVPPRGFVIANLFSRWRSKAWPLERWAVLVHRLRQELGVAVVATGWAEEAADMEILRARAGAAAPPSLVGRTTLEQALCLYRRAALMISGDTGPLHAAAAVGTPTVALFGPTWPERTGPWGADHLVVVGSRPSSPKAYSEDGAGRHMQAIEIDTVFEATRAALGTAAREPRAADERLRG